MPDYSLGIAPLAVVIMGVCGSGKSTVGVELANAIACPFLEGDSFHTPQAIQKMQAGEPLTDEDRWPWLDQLGHAVAAEIARCGVVIAACSALKRIYRDRLRERIAAPVRFVLLDGDPEELWRRLSTRRGHYMPASLLSSQLEILEPPQPDESAIRLDAGRSPSVLCGEIIAWLGTTNVETQP